MAPYKKSKRETARRLYLTGEAPTVAEIARRLKVKPHTIGLWKKDEDWDELRFKIDKRAAEQLVEQLAGERVKINSRHIRLWTVIGGKLVALIGKDRTDGEEVKNLEKQAAILERMQKGQRLAAGLSLDGQTEEQIRAQFQADSRALVDFFVELVKTHVPDEQVRDTIARDLLARAPQETEDKENTDDAP